MTEYMFKSTKNYRELRSAYDFAFRQFAREMQRVNLLRQSEDAGSSCLLPAQQRLSAAWLEYQQSRNALAAYMLNRQAASRVPAEFAVAPLAAKSASAFLSV